MGFEGVDKGMKFRDLMARIARGVIDKDRPPYRYGQVTAIDHALRRCDVLFTGDSESVSVPVGSVFPSFINQMVRVDGIGTDRYIADVIGDAQPNRAEMISVGADLNDYRWPGLYGTNLDANARQILNWPATVSGNLRVTSNPTTSMIYQEVTTYTGLKYHREWYNGVWRPWVTEGFTVCKSDAEERVLVARAVPTRENPLFVHRMDKAHNAGSLRMTTDGAVWAEIETKPSFATWRTDGFNSVDFKQYGGYAAFGYLKTSANIVVLGGLVDTGASGKVICTLPDGYRPDVLMTFPIAMSLSGGSIGRVDVYPDGRVVAVKTDPGWTSLDGIQFPAAGSINWQVLPLVNAWEAYQPASWGVPQYGQDVLGRVWFTGMVMRPAQPTDDYAIAELPTILNPPASQQLHFLSIANSVACGLDIAPKGTTTSHLPNNPSIRFKKGGSVAWISLCPIMYTPHNWRNFFRVPYSNGWASYNGAEFPGVEYMVHTDGLVQLQGLTNIGTLGAAAGTLPEGARPSNFGDRIFPVASANLYSRTDVGGNGAIKPLTAVASWKSFNGINYIIEN